MKMDLEESSGEEEAEMVACNVGGGSIVPRMAMGGSYDRQGGGARLSRRPTLRNVEVKECEGIQRKSKLKSDFIHCKQKTMAIYRKILGLGRSLWTFISLLGPKRKFRPLLGIDCVEL